MNTPKLPPLPTPVEEICMEDGFDVIGTQPVFTAEQMQAYALAAIDAQGVPDGLLDVLDRFEKKERSPFQAYLAAGLANELRTAMLASAPPAPQARTPHPAFAFRECEDSQAVKEPQASVVQQEPNHWVVPDYGFLFPSEDAAKRYLDNIGSDERPTACYTHPAQQAKPQLLSDEQDRALCEAHCDAASDEYFKARPQLDSDVNRRIFYAGHRKAWINWQAAHGIKE